MDTVAGSKLANLKELRPGSSGGTEVRLLFIFDPQRRAVFLVGGDKEIPSFRALIPKDEDPGGQQRARDPKRAS